MVVLLSVLVAAAAYTVGGHLAKRPKACESALPTSQALTPHTIRTWAVIGDDLELDQSERRAGVNAKVIRLSWKQAEPHDGVFSGPYLADKLAEICALDASGLRVILDWGIQDTPAWIHRFPNSYLVDQYGERWTASTLPGQTADDSDADLVFDPILRRLAQRYIEDIARRLGPHVAAIRIGGGRDNELSFPTASTPLHQNTYWAYSAWAQRSCPVPGWRPGDPSPAGQARRFLPWYVDSLTRYERWQMTTLRRYYEGPMILLFPSWGLRPGQMAQTVSDDLEDRTAPEQNGEPQRGLNFAGEVSAIDLPRVWVETTWADASNGSDSAASSASWRPIHYLSSLLSRQAEHPQLWAENTGEGSAADLRFAVGQAEHYGASGFVWYDEAQLMTGRYATLPDLAAEIRDPR